MIAAVLFFVSGILSPYCQGLPVESWSTCVEVSSAATLDDVPPDLAVSLAWHESAFRRDMVSRAGAAGPMQVIPRWACPRGQADGCDLVRAGTRTLARLVRRHGPERAVCHYNAGNVCGRRAARYARAVVRGAERLRGGKLLWK
jgi:soluble lytic murein transglycosylase-like protein